MEAQKKRTMRNDVILIASLLAVIAIAAACLFLLRGEEEKNAPNRMHQASLARSIGLCSGLGIFILLI